jgi:Arc-like DNA binding domain
MNRAQAPKTTLRMPADVVEWLKLRAERNITSMTAEMVRVVRERMAQEGRTGMEVDPRRVIANGDN